MSIKTRIHRPTTSTPRKDVRPPRYLHVSTNYQRVKTAGGEKVIKVGKGTTRTGG